MVVIPVHKMFSNAHIERKKERESFGFVTVVGYSNLRVPIGLLRMPMGGGGGGGGKWLIALSPQGKNRAEVFLINEDWQSLGGNCVMWVTGSRKLGVGWQKLPGTLYLNSLAFSVSALFGEVCFLASWLSSFPQILFKLPVHCI